MPTGYTHDVHEGKITTLQEFATRCIRGLGVCITMRDDAIDAPPPREFKADTAYYDKAIAEARAALDELPTLSAAECDKRASAEFELAMAAHIRSEADDAVKERRYREMLAQTQAWKAPSEIETLRAFMIEQLTRSIEFDHGGGYRAKPPVRLTGEKWREAQLAEASRNLAYHEKERAKEVDRVNSRNAYLLAFWRAFPDAAKEAK